MEDEDELPYIGNRGDALELLAQLSRDLGRVRPESGARYLGKARRAVRALKAAIGREIIQ
jgi:hypothetical protein